MQKVSCAGLLANPPAVSGEMSRVVLSDCNQGGRRRGMIHQL